MSLVGKRNCYTCHGCGKYIVTIDRDEGTTPFMLECLLGCGGMMQSSFYTGHIVNAAAKPTYEWRKPSKDEYRKSSPAMKQHFDMGGLDIHAIESARDQALLAGKEG